MAVTLRVRFALPLLFVRVDQRESWQGQHTRKICCVCSTGRVLRLSVECAVRAVIMVAHIKFAACEQPTAALL